VGVCLHNIFVSEWIGLDTASVLVASGKAHQGVHQEMYVGLDVSRVTSGRAYFNSVFQLVGCRPLTVHGLMYETAVHSW
jgi:hypothetical protein